MMDAGNTFSLVTAKLELASIFNDGGVNAVGRNLRELYSASFIRSPPVY